MMPTWKDQSRALIPFLKDYSKMIGKLTDIAPQNNPSVPACQPQPELHQHWCETVQRMLPRRAQTGSQQGGALWAALSWLQLLSLSTEKGQVPFGASVGVVSFLTTLITGDLLQRPRSPVARAAVLTLHDPDDLRGSLLIGRRVLTR